jgi:diaminohydroxyphosphoribosylaminopyrimidine deaminase/5-amino-6-(5-phosphoribosylamino)uracil reductase
LNWSEADYRYMSRALQLARRGLYTTHPNPRVGCVIVKDGRTISEGWHRQTGGPHAEVHALNLAGEQAKGADCYVTLEPCVHTGKTPPCTDAVIAAGIKRVIVAATDPNPKVSGKGIDALHKAGIVTEAGLLQAQAQALNPGFEMRMRHGRPYVRCKLAMSMDGRTAMADGASKWITGDAARADVQRLRAQSSAIVTGINTVLADDPSLTVRGVDILGRQPLRVVLDRRLKIPKEAKLFSEPGETMVFTVYGCPDRENAMIKANRPVIRVSSSGEKDFLLGVMRYLAKEKEINEVLVESGPTLAGSLLQAGLVDELIIYVAPLLLGHEAKALLNLPGIKSMTDKIRLQFADVRMVGKDMRITLTPVKSNE